MTITRAQTRAALEDIRDALALAFVLGIIACLYIAMQPHTPHEVRPTASVTRFAEAM